MPLVPRTLAERPSKTDGKQKETRKGSIQSLAAWLPFNLWGSASSSTAEAASEEDAVEAGNSQRSTGANATPVLFALSPAVLARHNLRPKQTTFSKPPIGHVTNGYPGPSQGRTNVKSDL